MRMKTAVAGALVGAVVGLGGIAGAQDLGTAGHKEKVKDLWIYAEPTGTDVFIEAQGGEDDGVIEVGDRNLFTEVLYQSDHGKPAGDPIGMAHIECVVTHVEGTQPAEPAEGEAPPDLGDFDAALQCVASLELGEERQLYLQTLLRFANPTNIIGGVTGGAGKFAGANGGFELIEPDEDPETDGVVYHIELVK